MLKARLTVRTAMTRIRVLILWMSIGLYSYSQFLQLKFDHITSEDGLPQSTIHGIRQEKHGCMWFGTWSGLCRYDGYNIGVYRYAASNPRSLINNRIHDVLSDNKGNLWLPPCDEAWLCPANSETDDFERPPI